MSLDLRSLDQLWFTWTHRGLEVSQGFQVRAASAGLRDLRGARLSALRPHLTYALPAGCDPANTPAGGGPRSLALVDVGEERALLHRVYAGRDPYARPGNFFIHALVGAAEALPLAEAARSWKAPLWVTADQDGVDARQDLPALDLGSLAARQQWTASSLEGASTAFTYALEWCLTCKDDGRLFLAAEPDAVAAVVFALSQTVPRFLWRRMTFSTYERDVLRSPARIVGAWQPARLPGSSEEPDLPPACYSDHAAFNFHTGKRATLPAIPEAAAYAAWAGAALLAGATAQLSALLAAVDNAGCERVAELLLAHRYWDETAPLPETAIGHLLAEPRVCALLLRREEVREGIISRIQDDSAWWDSKGRDAWKRLAAAVRTSERRDAAPMHDRLLDAVHGRAARAVDKLQIAALVRLLEARQVLMSDGAASVIDAMAEHLFAAGQRPSAAMPWADRLALLTMIGAAKRRPAAQDIAPLLSAPPSHTAEALSLSLPQDWAVLIATNAIRAATEHDCITDIHSALQQHPGVFELALKRMLADSRAVVASFMRQAAAIWSAGPECLLELLKTTGYDDPAFYEELARGAVINLLPERLAAFIDAHASVLLRNGAISAHSTKLLGQYLTGLSVDRCQTAATLVALNQFAAIGREEPGWPEDLGRLLAAWRELALFLTYGVNTPESLRQLSRAREVLERRLTADTMRTERDAIDRALVERLVLSIQTSPAIEAALASLGPALKGRLWLFGALLDAVERHGTAEQRRERRFVYWRYGLDRRAGVEGALRERTRRLDPGRYHDLDERLKAAVARRDLPADSWKQWQGWTEHLRPKKLLGFIGQ